MRRLPSLRRQRGVAIITALLLTALAITIVTSLFWQQQVQVRSMENQRLHLQTRWIVRGALDYARLVLQQDGRSSQITALDGIWATPLAETRLDDYVERERVEGDNYKATLSGQISDAQARYNLANLAANKVVIPDQVAVFRRLLASLQVDSSLAQAAAQALAGSQAVVDTSAVAGSGSGIGTAGSTTDSGTSTGTTGATTTATSSGASTGGSGTPMGFVQVDDLLSVPGFTPQIVEQLRGYVTVLPSRTAINVNTASPQLLAALVENLSVSEATALTHKRDFASAGAFTTLLGGNRPVSANVPLAAKSNYFIVVSHVLLDRAELDAEALIQRDDLTATVVSIREN